MKKILVLLIAALVVITISCSDKGGGGSSSGFPTIPSTGNWAWPQVRINTVLYIWAYPEKDGYIELYIVHFNENVPLDCVIKINNETIAVPDTSDWYYDEWWIDSTHVYESYEYWDVVYVADDIDPGETLTYSVKINNTTDTGSLKIPYQLYCSFPDFDIEKDYHFGWTIQESPSLHYVFFDIEDAWYKYEIYRNFKLSGNVREYTISKSLYQDFIGDEYWVWVDVNAINYKRSGDFLAMSYSWDYYDNDWKSDSILDRKLHRERLLKALLNDLGAE